VLLIMAKKSKYRWVAVGILFLFMLLHQSDRLLIGSMTTAIMEDFGINRAQMGAVSTAALIVAALFYPLWGYLYDRYARSKLLALASLLWGASTWLAAIAPTYPTFVATRASTGIDDSSYPGVYSLVSDYFGPRQRGKIYGLLELTAPVGFLIGMLLGLFLAGAIGWRGVFYLTGSLGLVMAVVIFFGLREPQRGSSEPEMANLEHISNYKFNWQAARAQVKIPTQIILFAQGFFGVFPWNVITFWFINYLQTERGYSDNTVFLTMGVAVVALAIGYPLGGALGDYLFQRTPRGRVIVAITGVVVGAVMLAITLNVPIESQGLFLVMMTITALFMPFPAPNMISTVQDIALPEVRSSSLSIQLLIESSGAALAPLIAGAIADQSSLKTSFLMICLTAWALCAVFYVLALFTIPKDTARLRLLMRQRAASETQLQSGETS
jgi:MFS transporter, Spinster family, sphingosine-1-phosphate transporter